jgi:membrane-associated protease RseP (regulator of RpoE activity)
MLQTEKSMKHLLRPDANTKGWLAAALLAACALCASAQSAGLRMMVPVRPLLLLGNSQGYLGVDLGDVDAQKAQALKLREARGAVITLIDHDAPAGKIGLRVNDVVLEMNNQPVQSAEQLRHMLHETPSGRKISLLVSRDGNTQTVAVELADRKAIEHEAWDHIDRSGDRNYPSPAMGMLAGGGTGDAPASSGWHIPFFGPSLNVGVVVEPLNRQMAEVLGIKNGLLIKQVTHRSSASVAGFKALDVILKVGSEPISTMSGWDRALRANQGKSIQVIILRDKKQQTVTLQVDAKRHG